MQVNVKIKIKAAHLLIKTPKHIHYLIVLKIWEMIASNNKDVVEVKTRDVVISDNKVVVASDNRDTVVYQKRIIHVHVQMWKLIITTVL